MKIVILNKPYDVLSQFRKDEAHMTMADFVDDPNLRLAGRLDMDSEGLVFLTDHGGLNQYITNPANKKYKTYFGKDDWKGSVYDFYRDFLHSQKEYDIAIPKDSFDVYDLAALAYIYKRIKETDPVREASHVVIDEAQDFGMMAYCCLHYCLRNCTYTIMGDT